MTKRPQGYRASLFAVFIHILLLFPLPFLDEPAGEEERPADGGVAQIQGEATPASVEILQHAVEEAVADFEDADDLEDAG